MDFPYQTILLVVFVIMSGFFSGVETAFVSLSDIRIRHLVEQNRQGILLVKQLKDNYQRLIITLLIGNNLVNIAASSIATSIAINMNLPNAVGIAVGVMTFVILVFGEILPKSIAMTHNEWIAIHMAPMVRLLQFVFFPFIKLLEWMMILLSKPFGSAGVGPIITEAEIKSVVRLGESIGEVEEDERIMIHNIFRFSDLEASDIMIDRTQIFSIEADAILENVANDIIENGFSRIPVYEHKRDNIVGILYIKDVLQALLDCKKDQRIGDMVRPAMFIPETMLIDDLLRAFQLKKIHMAMIVDEHGGVSGLVTIEDLLEEIVGDINDESDEDQMRIRKIDKNRSIVKGETEITEINRALHLRLSEKDDYETISGFILANLRRIPHIGEELTVKNTTFRVLKADDKHIIEVEIIRIPAETLPRPSDASPAKDKQATTEPAKAPAS